MGTALEAIATWVRIRRTMRELSRLDDKILSDIGISRSDIERIARDSAVQPSTAALLVADHAIAPSVGEETLVRRAA